MPIPLIFNKPCTNIYIRVQKGFSNSLKDITALFSCNQSESRKTLGRYYKRVNIYLRCYLYFIELAEKDRRRPIMSEGVGQAGSHPTAHKGRWLDGWFNDSAVCGGAGDQVETFCVEGTAWVGEKNVMWCLLSVWWSSCCWFWFSQGCSSLWRQESCLPSPGSSVFWDALTHQICIEPQPLTSPHPSEGAWTSTVVFNRVFSLIP